MIFNPSNHGAKNRNLLGVRGFVEVNRFHLWVGLADEGEWLKRVDDSVSDERFSIADAVDP